MPSELSVRPFSTGDTESIVALWRSVLPSSKPWNEPATEIRRKSGTGDQLFLVGELDGNVVATAVAGYDGVRGWIYRLAVVPDLQGQGLGREMLQAAENALSKLGCPKVNLQIRSDNLDVLKFYQRCGYETEDRASLGKPLLPAEPISTSPTPNNVINEIHFKIEPDLSSAEFVDLLQRSTLAERRPVKEPETIEAMLRGAQVIMTARAKGKLIGISRAISDFAYSTYLSDLAVDVEFQRRGIGKELIRRTHEAAGLNTTLILLAAPKAVEYYPHIGMSHAESCWITPRESV